MKHQLPNPNRKNAKPVSYDYLFVKTGGHVAGEGNRHQRRGQFVNPKLIKQQESTVPQTEIVNEDIAA